MSKCYASEVIKLAKAEVGTVEKPVNDVKYNTWYYGRRVNGDAYKWCMVFISFLLDKCGGLHLIGGKSASCANTINWFQKHKQWHTSNPKVGDLVFFTYSHVGLVIEVHNGYVVTIEGNTSSGNSGSQRNGGGVYKRTRNSSIKGYGRPKYDAKPKKEKTKKKTTKKPATSTTATKPKTTDKAKSVNYKVKVTAASLRIRKSYSTLSKILGRYKKGKIVQVTKEYKGWLLTSKGWISAKYTTKVK